MCGSLRTRQAGKPRWTSGLDDRRADIMINRGCGRIRAPTAHVVTHVRSSSVGRLGVATAGGYTTWIPLQKCSGQVLGFDDVCALLHKLRESTYACLALCRRLGLTPPENCRNHLPYRHYRRGAASLQWGPPNLAWPRRQVLRDHSHGWRDPCA